MKQNISHIIIHYSEIGIKGNNRGWFENKLAQNIKNKLKKEFLENFNVQRISGRLLIEFNTNLSPKSIASLQSILSTIFGVANFSFAVKSSQKLELLKKDSWEMMKDKTFKTFRITTKRSNKNFSMTSEEVNREIGAYIWKKLATKKKEPIVNLKNPDIEIFVEIVDQNAFIYTEKIDGAGGMPIGTSGKALSLLSGGIDSPVASYYGLKRGVKIDFVHFHSLPYTSTASNEKVIALAKKLNKFQNKAQIFMVPFAKIQQEIVMNCPEKLRILMYRRLMMQIAERTAFENKYLALYTGESVAQVASQTLENISATNDAVSLPVLRPLIGFDKIEIIAKAQEIDTYEISILPHEDCCTRFIPKHPETRAKLTNIHLAEKNLDIRKLIQQAVSDTEIVKI